MPLAAIVGGVVGAVMLILLTCLIARFLVRRQKAPMDP